MTNVVQRALRPWWRRYLRHLSIVFLVAVGAGLSYREPAPVIQFREAIWDQYVTLKPRPFDPSLGVRIIDIDDRSLAAYGQWPWPRTRMARLVNALDEAGAGVIAFDVIFAEPDRTSLDQVFSELARDLPDYHPPLDAAQIAAHPKNDVVFAKAILGMPVVLGLTVAKSDATANDVVKGVKVRYERRKDQRYLPRFGGAIAALPELQKAAAANGGLDMVTDHDGVTRRLPILFKIAKRTVPSLALAAVSIADGGQISVRSRRPGLAGITIGGREIPTDRYGRMRIYDSGSFRARYISAGDVLSGKLAPGSLNGGIAVVGTGAEGLSDLRLTPLATWVPGMEVHAQAIEQILSGMHLTRPDDAALWEMTGLIVMGLLMVAAVAGNHRWAPAWLIAVAGSCVLIAVGWHGFSSYRILLDPVLASATLLSAAIIERFILVIELRRERSAVRDAFSHYMSPAMVEKLVRDPTLVRLGGERRHMTFLFCDIRGFTSISETFQNDPAGLTSLINRFLTPMTDAILAHNGTIDKYMGDCIMAFWNAPLDDPGHARNAMHAALAMIRSLDGVNASLADEAAVAGTTPIALRVGIGLNSGDCVVGNMGSEQRFDYSVLGDAVNLASRFEGQSKNYGVDIVIGEATHLAAPELASFELDLIAVKGKTEATRIYALLGDEERAKDADHRAVRARHAEMLAAYRAQDWDSASTGIDRLRALAPDLEVLCDLYAARVADYRANPPGSDWDGVFIAESK